MMMVVARVHAEVTVLVNGGDQFGNIVGLEVTSPSEVKVTICKVGGEEFDRWFPLWKAVTFHLGEEAEFHPAMTDSIMVNNFLWLVNNLPPDALMCHTRMCVSARAEHENVVLTLYRGEEKTPTLLVHLRQMDERRVEVSCMQDGVDDPILLKDFAMAGLACFMQNGQCGTGNVELFLLGEELLASQEKVATLGDD